jgi:hypothetical protein
MTNIQRLLKIPTVLLGTALLATSCAGTVGSAGSAGAQGPVGPQGPQGLTGAIGSTGPQGPVGPAGPQGLSGAQGPRGFSGSDGSQGVNGQSAYQIYIAEYPGYVNLGGANTGTQTRWINELASNALYPTINLNYTGQTDFAADFTDEPLTFKVFKGQTFAQFPLIDLFDDLTQANNVTRTLADYNLQFYSDSTRTNLITGAYAFGVDTIIYVKATPIINITSLIIENVNTANNITSTGNMNTGFTLNVPLETTGFSSLFTNYLFTTNFAVKTDGKIYTDSAATVELPQLIFVMRDGVSGTGTNLTNDILSTSSAARTSFGIFQQSGSPTNGAYLSFATAGTTTIYVRIFEADNTPRIVRLNIVVAAAALDITSLIIENVNTANNITSTGNMNTGFTLNVPLETTGFSSLFTNYLFTTNFAVKTDGKIYTDSAATVELPQLIFVMRDGVSGTGTNLTNDILSTSSAARTSFGIFQQSGSPTNGAYLSFATAGTTTIYVRIFEADNTPRIVRLNIVVAAA